MAEKTAPVACETARRVEIDGVEIKLTRPDRWRAEWIGNPFQKQQLLAAWMRASPLDHPMNPRLVGAPGLGKTTMAFVASEELGLPVYLFQCTMDTRPEDLIVTPVLSGRGRVEYRASPLLTAVIQGGAAILDEGNRMNERAWASLAPLLDDRRYVESIVCGVKVAAHPEFRLVTTMNDDASTYELPEYIQSRLRPRIEVSWPDAETEEKILRVNLPEAQDEVIRGVVSLLQQAHAKGSPLTPRDGITLARYAQRLSRTGLRPQRALETALSAVADEKTKRKSRPC